VYLGREGVKARIKPFKPAIKAVIENQGGIPSPSLFRGTPMRNATLSLTRGEGFFIGDNIMNTTQKHVEILRYIRKGMSLANSLRVTANAIDASIELLSSERTSVEEKEKYLQALKEVLFKWER
jgi:hypothetical protein